MTDRPDPDQIKGPGGLTLRQIHQQTKKSVAWEQNAKTRNAAAQKENRWQRFVRFVWDKNRGRG
ncbi:MAG: hypothetical protein JNK68_15200 [Betaproteobacteria bacterium]|nr:hypothetical protein [Betaproteobacteria bacterium]